MTDTPAAQGESLNRQLVRGLAWTSGAKWLTQALSWVSTIVLARLLTKEDYGIVGMATLYLGFVAVLTEGGLSTSIVALRNMTRHEIAQFQVVALMLGFCGTVLTWAAAVPLSHYFRRPELPWVIVALGASAFLSAIRLVPNAVLQRDLRFRALAGIDAIQSIVNAVMNVVFALLGFRYWSLVLSGAAANLIGAVVSQIVKPAGLALPSRGGIGKYVTFTRDILIGRVAWYAYTNADFLVAGRFLGAASLGAYTFAWNIASVPVEKVTSLIARVTPAFFARLREDNQGTRRLLVNVTDALAFLTLPASLGLAAVADDLVPALLGPQWTEAILPLEILAFYASFRSICTLLPQILTVKGDTSFLMWNGILTAIALPAGFWVGSRWGGAGIAAGWVTVYPLFVYPLYRRTFRKIGLSAGEYLRVLWPTLGASVLMTLGILAVKWLLPGTFAHGARLGIEFAVGAGLFLVLGYLPRRDRIRELKQLLTGRAPAPTAPTVAQNVATASE